MSSYLTRIEQAASSEQWPHVREWMDTKPHAAINALEWLLSDRDLLAAAVRSARPGPGEFDGYVLEALRFHPAFPYFARVCESAVTAAAGTDCAEEIRPGTTVLAITHSAIFEATAFPNAEAFDPDRTHGNSLHFGRETACWMGRFVRLLAIMVSSFCKGAGRTDSSP
jgi:cytochrome P450